VPTDPSGCLLPFPNDYDTVADPTTATGRRVALPAAALPVAAGDEAPDPSVWAGNDGFSPGSLLLAHVPGVDLAASGAATLSDMGRSLGPASPVVLLDTTTGQRWPTWAELDADDHDPATRLLVIHPTQDLSDGDHFVVALRALRTATGGPIAPAGVMAAVDAGTGTTPFEHHLQADEATLVRHGALTDAERAGVDQVWDFTVASTADLTGPDLAMRDQAFARLGSAAPAYDVTSVVDDPHALPALAREVSGTFTVPSFLTGPLGQGGTTLTTDGSGRPVLRPGATVTAPFRCEVPKAATAARPAQVGVYGHGLFGSADEVFASDVPQFSQAHDYVFCATDWAGLSQSTLGLAAGVISNLAQFPTLAANLQQSLLDAQFLGRMLTSPSGLARNPAFEVGGRPVIATGTPLVYYGNSEGGIMGGAFTALSTETRRAVLGVPGMDYALLLPRSADFSPFLSVLDHSYPDKATQLVGFDLIQMLWDRAEADGYAQQMTGGLPGTPSHQVLLEEAFGDHQVANISTETEARTIGASVIEPALTPGRSHQAEPLWDLPAFGGGGGPVLTVWDSGVPAPPLSDTPPTAGPDPHDTTPRNDPAFWAQMNTFLRTGRVTDPCGGHPCRAPYPPPSS
jgi:hypothetical protein